MEVMMANTTRLADLKKMNPHGHVYALFKSFLQNTNSFQFGHAHLPSIVVPFLSQKCKYCQL